MKNVEHDLQLSFYQEILINYFNIYTIVKQNGKLLQLAQSRSYADIE